MKPIPKWRSELINMLAAAIIALLVWAYANDRTRESASVSGTIRLTAADPRDQFVDPSTALSIAVELRGSRRSIEAYEDALRTGLTVSTGATGLPTDSGAHVASLKEVLTANATLAATGAELLRVRPESLRYESGTLITEQVPVATTLANTAVRGNISIDPQVVTVTLPESARKSLGALTVDAAIDTKNLEPGKAQQVDVELRLPESLAKWKELCRVVPPRAKVSFELLATNSEYLAPFIAVRLAMPTDLLNRWEITFEQGSERLADVMLSGPEASLAEIRSGAFAPAAVVDLGSDAPRIGNHAYPVTFWNLPAGVSVARNTANATRTVMLRVMPRSNP